MAKLRLILLHQLIFLSLCAQAMGQGRLPRGINAPLEHRRSPDTLLNMVPAEVTAVLQWYGTDAIWSEFENSAASTFWRQPGPRRSLGWPLMRLVGWAQLTVLKPAGANAVDDLNELRELIRRYPAVVWWRQNANESHSFQHQLFLGIELGQQREDFMVSLCRLLDQMKIKFHMEPYYSDVSRMVYRAIVPPQWPTLYFGFSQSTCFIALGEDTVVAALTRQCRRWPDHPMALRWQSLQATFEMEAKTTLAARYYFNIEPAKKTASASETDAPMRWQKLADLSELLGMARSQNGNGLVECRADAGFRHVLRLQAHNTEIRPLPWLKNESPSLALLDLIPQAAVAATACVMDWDEFLEIYNARNPKLDLNRVVNHLQGESAAYTTSTGNRVLMFRCSDPNAINPAIEQAWQQAKLIESPQVEIIRVNNFQIHIINGVSPSRPGSFCWAIHDDWLLLTADLDSMTCAVEHLDRDDRRAQSVRSRPGIKSLELPAASPVLQLTDLNEALPHALSSLPSMVRLLPPLGLIVAGGDHNDTKNDDMQSPSKILQVNTVQIDDGGVTLIETGPLGGAGWMLWPLSTLLPVMEPGL